MFTTQLKERFAFGGFINAVSNAAASGVESVNLNSVQSLDMSKYNRAIGIFMLGTKGAAATWNCRLQESTDGSTFTNITGPNGTNPALVTTLQIANQCATVEIRADQLTKRYIRIQMSDANGTAASVIAAALLGFDKKYAPVKSADHATGVNTQIVTD